MSHCQRCGHERPPHDLYSCRSCGAPVCPGCLDPSNVSLCKECGVLARNAEIVRRLKERCKHP